MRPSYSYPLLLALLLLLLSAGCVGQQRVHLDQWEGIQSSNAVDVDNDGQSDFFTYAFQPVDLPQAGVRIERTLLVYRQVHLQYDRYQNLTDYQVLVLSQTVEDFQQSVDASNKQCLNHIGLGGVNCIDVHTCARLCSASSAGCKRLVDDYEEVVGENVLRYGQHSSVMADSFYQSLRTIATLVDTPRSDRTYLSIKLETILNELYALEASPLVQSTPVNLCSAGNYDPSRWKEALEGIGNYRTETTGYGYTMLLKITPLSQANQTLSQTDLTFHERLPLEFIAPDTLVSPLPLASQINGSLVELSFEPIRKLDDRSKLLMYSFSSTHPPGDWIGQLKTPSVSMQVLDLSALSISAFLYDRLSTASGNLYIALGLSLGISIMVVLLVLSLLGLLWGMVRAVLAKEKPITGLRRAFSRTVIRWKSDLILGLILLSVGIVVSLYFAPQIRERLDIFALGEYILTEPAGFIASTGIFFGTVLLYMAVENRIRVFGLEDSYGRETRQDRDLSIANGKQLKEKLKVLRQLVEAAGKENFDISGEYDVLAGINEERIEGMAQKTDELSMRTIQDELIKVEEAIERLRDREKSAEQNWPQWKGIIEKMVEESEELHASQLLTIPTSLRVWALNKYVQEAGSKDVILEGKVIKRKKFSPERLVQGMFDQGLVSGMVVIRNDQVSMAKITSGSSAVAAVLALKLVGYLRTTARNFGYGNYASFAGVGSNFVLLVSKEQNLETLLVVPRDKFKDALAAWKEKAKYFV